jgi:hypothetical protein
MKCVILQPSYIPWRGYFHQIYKADLFIFYDDVKYDKNGWRNRNRIKTPNGIQWLTIPVHIAGVETNKTPIYQIKNVRDRPWNRSHWDTIRQSYRKAPYFHQYAPQIEDLYLNHCQSEYLADFTIETSEALERMLGIHHTRFLRSSEMKAIEGVKTARLIQILKQVGATHYISGPSARDYVERELFDEAGITFEYMEYNYRPYPQLYPPYDPQVSILDLLFMTGPDALDYIIHE